MRATHNTGYGEAGFGCKLGKACSRLASKKMMVLLSEAVGYRLIDAHALLESSPLIACNW